MYKHIGLLFLSLLFSLGVQAQYYSYGTEPTHVQWKQIKTDHFQVIYPKGFDSVAQVFTKKLTYVYDLCSQGLQHQPKRISVILHNQTNISNGSVTWCPKQMDVYTIPSQNQHSQEWFENLAIHEFRHVVQMDKMNQGLTHILSFLLGEDAVGLLSGIYLPRWLLEGDAVCTETALSLSGRGRQADFFAPYRAQLYEKGAYSYSKAYFGSYKDFVPDYYLMGYILLSNTRKNYGQGLESQIINNASINPLQLLPVQNAVMQKTGHSKRDLYSSIFEEQANEWKLKHDREIQTPYDTIRKAGNVFTSYVSGNLCDSVFYYERKGLNTISQLICLKNGKENVIRNVGFKPSEERIHSNGRSLVWQEIHYSVRWEMKQSSTIYIYDIAKHKTHTIRTKRHLFSPAISPSNERIVAAEIAENGRYYLSFFEKNSKECVKQIPSPNNDAILQPSWNENGSKVIFIGLNSVGKRIMEFDVQDGTFEEILPYSVDDYGSPLYWKEYVLYTSSYSGVDNIYAYNKTSQQTSRITVADFGSKFPSVTDSTLVYSNYTANGYELATVHLNPKFWHPLSVVKKENYNLATMMTNQSGGPVDFSKMDIADFPTKHYSKLLHAINIHSWMPAYMNYNGSEVEDHGNGVQVLSQNHLGTTIASVGYKWSKTDGYRKAFAHLVYRGLLPVFELDYELGNQDFVTIDDYTKDSVTANYAMYDFSGRMYVPFNFSSNSFYRSVVPQIQVGFQNFEKQEVTPAIYYGNFKRVMSANYVFYALTVSNMRKQSMQELYARWGQKISIGYEKVPFEATEDFSDYAFAEASLYFPGFMRNHSFRLYGGYEWNKSMEKGNFSRQISIPRGYLDGIAMKKEMLSLQANYSFPLFYPDMELGDVWYLKRIRCNLFADWARTKSANEYSSFGTEILTDSHFFNLVVPVNLGIRLSYLPKENSAATELLFSMNLGDL
ncbi:MAG: hypothetical protein MJ197_04625 [Bacteroidales bacterium]|nr:hypothetical protein [Bacteroidales bacterium]